MKISLADFSHKEELAELWIEAFGDSENFIASFLDAYMIPEYNVPVIIEDGKIASALYLVEFELYSETKNLGNCAYLFAAATKKDQQNKGFMSKLVLYSAELCKNRGLKAIFLFPQNQDKKLFDFYAKAKFEPIYCAKRITKKSSPESEKKDFTGYKLERKDISDVDVFDGLYDSYVDFTSRQELAPMKDRLFYFKCASEYLKIPENSKTGTYFAVFENNVEKFCYVFYKKYKNTYYIDDIILSADRSERFERVKYGDNKKRFSETAELLADFIVNSGTFGENITLGMNVLPSRGNGGQNIPLAMILPLSEDIKNITRNLEFPVYINMFMNI